MALILGTDDHNLAVSLDNLAFVAHRFNRRSYFHKKTPFLAKISRLGRAIFSAISGGSASLPAIVRCPRDYIIAGIPFAEAINRKLGRAAQKRGFACYVIYFRILCVSCFNTLPKPITPQSCKQEQERKHSPDGSVHRST